MLRGLLIWTLLMQASSIAMAIDFRIETKVYAGDQEVPVSQNTTLFQNGVVYDFLETTGRVAIFRAGHGDQPGRFVLLDPQHSIKTELQTTRIDTVIDKLTVWARAQRDPLLVFHADPKFAETFDETSATLLLAHPLMTYRAVTKPITRGSVEADLRNYFDAYAKLNCILASPMPPMPRLELNESLAKHKVYPTEVSLTIPGNKVTGEQDTKLRAEHTFTWLLSKDDRSRITLVGEQLVSFQEVSNAAFQRQSMVDE